eukprot:13851676-Ditylum_brightwellii.AAC.1
MECRCRAKGCGAMWFWVGGSEAVCEDGWEGDEERSSAYHVHVLLECDDFGIKRSCEAGLPVEIDGVVDVPEHLGVEGAVGCTKGTVMVLVSRHVCDPRTDFLVKK